MKEIREVLNYGNILHFQDFWAKVRKNEELKERYKTSNFWPLKKNIFGFFIETNSINFFVLVARIHVFVIRTPTPYNNVLSYQLSCAHGTNNFFMSK